ncbi:MAG: pirin family protein [Spirochaetota bacterium]
MDREPALIRKSQPTMEGAGVRLRRAFGHGDSERVDPFLMLDDFRGDRPADYQRGFPWHPHRGIETITYMLAGQVEHQDSLGNKGVIGTGAVQWMTAGRGIIHQEMPVGSEGGRMGGFQLWANLPARDKMMGPRYQDIAASAIPERVQADGSRVRVIAGAFEGITGPVEGIVTNPDYLDLELAPGADLRHRVEPGKSVFVYVFGGEGRIGEGPVVGDSSIVFLGQGDSVRLRATGSLPFRLLLCAGMGLGEPVAWHGPIVMNSQAELDLAFRQLDEGTFLGG